MELSKCTPSRFEPHACHAWYNDDSVGFLSLLTSHSNCIIYLFIRIHTTLFPIIYQYEQKYHACAKVLFNIGLVFAQLCCLT